MLEAKEVLEKDLKDGRDYMYIGGVRYRPDDCLLCNGQELTVKKILDQVHFFDQRNFCMHSHMFYDQKWEHCFERNADKKTKDRTQYAVIADRVRVEREAFKESMLKNYPYQIYESYGRINFFEKLSWHLINLEHEPDGKDSAALLKLSDSLAARNNGLMSDMYRLYSDKNANIGSKFDIERFVAGYIGEQQQQC